VFAWTGAQFEYVGDYLGVGGLGYLEAPGSYSRPDPTEVLELPLLVARSTEDGKRVFDVRIVEPLEECTYLDAVELVAVDVPAGIEVHPNELFPVRAPAPQAELWALREARSPAAARDHHGRDVRAEIFDRDRLYAENWKKDHRFPGVAESHTLELEWRDALPLANGTLRPVLFLYGYVEYTYSTSNFASVQAGITPRPPTVLVERDGKWIALREEWGFPAGTPRWMAMDLGELLEPGDRKLRVTTDQEIYWDQAFIAAAEPIPLGAIGERAGRGATRGTVGLAGAGSSVRVTILAPSSSELRFHGFPREIETRGTHPAAYAYPDADSRAHLKPFPGRYTAYGQTRDLLRDADDRLAILGEGDEVALEFDAGGLPPLEIGWTRTFFLASVGYCKDMDLYTAGGDQVEPLPFRSMSTYPPPVGERGKTGEAEQRLERRVKPLRLGRP
jgi:hypothetical protein